MPDSPVCVVDSELPPRLVMSQQLLLLLLLLQVGQARGLRVLHVLVLVLHVHAHGVTVRQGQSKELRQPHLGHKQSAAKQGSSGRYGIAFS